MESEQELERLRASLSDRYHVERELGRGGMATVFLARDLKHSRYVAIKVLRPELAAVVGRERFRKEIEIAARLRHTQILPVYDSGEADASLYYVMPYVQGQSLRQALQREKQLPLDDALRIAREVADALTYAHSNDVVHRDIKPENILLESGHAVVADFGIARAITASAGERLTETGLVVGTPTYMSPEQSSGESVDAKTDQYSLGCVLYEMLAGDPPFTGSSAQAIWARKAGGDVPSLRRVRHSVPDAVELALQRALATSPADRYPSVQAFVTALSASVPRARRRTVLGVGAAVALALSAGAVWKLNDANTPARFERLAVLPFANLTGDPNQQHVADAMHEYVIAELWQVAALTVVPRQTVLRFRDSNKSVSEIARELGVDAVVLGSVFRAADTVRTTVQLVQARPAERNLWGQTFQRNLGNLLSLQTDVARALAERIEVALTPSELQLLARPRRQTNPAAVEAWMRGWSTAMPASGPAMERCIGYAKEAIRIDSSFAPAHALAAGCYINLTFVTAMPSNEAFRRAKAAALRAIDLDPMLADAHMWLGTALAFEWDWEGADRGHARATQLAPGSFMAHWTYAFVLSWLGRHDKALYHALKAQDLDRDNPAAMQNLAMARYLARDYDEALTQARLVVSVHPNFGFGYDRLAHALEAKKMYAEAVLAREKAVELQIGDVRRKAYLGYMYGVAGRRDDAARILRELRELQKSSYVPPTAFAMLHLGLGQHEEAIDWFEKGYKERDGEMVLLKTWPSLDPLRSNPRFQRLVDGMRFPE